MPEEENTFKLNHAFFPLMPFYGLGVNLRNLMFNWGILKSEEYPVPVISVGNLTAGGTGKTPHTEYLINLLQDKFKLAVLSRGYKRNSKGYILADDKSSALTIGDEPFQIKRKFPDILVAVDSDRRRGITNLLSLPEDQKPEIILLDDAYQHRYVLPSLSIILTDYNRLFYQDKLLPVGHLREPANNINRADIVIVTKCPDNMTPIEYRIIEEDMRLSPHQKAFFSKVTYGDITPLFPDKIRKPVKESIGTDDQLLLIAGIASPIPFVREVKSRSEKAVSLIFPDHHIFDRQDIKKINDTFNSIKSPDKYILVTEKDAARLLRNPLLPEEWKEILYYLPIAIQFIAEKNLSFDDMIRNHITSFQQSKILRK